MASVSWNWWNLLVALDHNEVQELANAENVVTTLGGLLAGAPGPVVAIAKIVGAYLNLSKAWMTAADKGNGVYFHIPWLALATCQFWLIYPTTRPGPNPEVGGVQTGVIVRLSTGADFGPGSQSNLDWSHGPCYGSIGTYFADVTGEGRASCILVNEDTITVRRSTGKDFGPGPQANEDWAHGPCFGSRGTYFADVDGDGRAECILVNDDTIMVRRSTGKDFGPGPQANEDWAHGPCYGSIGTYFADVTGEGRASCILVNEDTITVRRSTGKDFGPGPQANENWAHGPLFGELGTYFVDVTGQGRASCIVVNLAGVVVRRSTGNDFGPGPQANEYWSHNPYYGKRGTFFADVIGNKRADAIVVNP